MDPKYKNYYSLLRFLKKLLPEYGICVRRMKLPKTLDGDCCYWEKTNTFYIRISNRFDAAYAMDILIHEIAHVIAWGYDKDDHGPNWGKSYSYLYREFLKWNDTP